MDGLAVTLILGGVALLIVAILGLARNERD
jgi:hypothetical protein